MRICVVGLGYIGLPAACLFADAGHEVIGIDVSKERAASINAAKPPFPERNLPELLSKVVSSGKLRASTDYAECADAEAILLCLPTPIENNKMDSRFLSSACSSLAPNLKRGCLVVVESTVSPGATAGLVREVIEKSSGMKAGTDFFLAHCPERAIPGDTLREMRENDRVVGGFNKESAVKAKGLYAGICNGKITETNCTASEFVKLAENIYRDVNIALANEFALAAEKLGVDVFEVINLANKHPRVFIHQPGAGVGGHCIPLDSWFLMESWQDAKLLPLCREINDLMPLHLVGILRKQLGSLKGKKIVLLGVAFKADVDDQRLTPAQFVAEALKKGGAIVVAVDPLVKKCGFAELKTLDEAVEGADAIAVTTAHSQFGKIDWPAVKNKMRGNLIVDGRGLFKKAPQGFELKGLGRGDLK
ncbi:MAG: nucleotide sugar dehydrogenase [Candidatus Micrarchaeota archaeon]